ncbi:MAG: hypothetical protein PHI37_00600 [Candidatus Gracilibacteria bacterium]|nr:hypothetical protein [Candidatus Gracilibacteria bacterium]
MYTNITNLETFDTSVLLNDNGDKNLKIELNDGTLLNALNYYNPELLGFRGDDIKNYSHNAIKLPSGKYIIYYKPLVEHIDNMLLKNISNDLENIDSNNVHALICEVNQEEKIKVDFFGIEYKENGYSNIDDYMIEKFAD